jgi:MFS family permease
VLLVVSMAALLRLHLPRVIVKGREGLRMDAIREGLSFVWTRPVMLGAMTLDMFAVIFGGAKALLPIYAINVLHTDATGFGVLSASLEVGALVMAVALVALPTPTETGRTLLASVAAFGLATVFFGVSTSMALSVLAYAAVGAADQVSMVMRQNTIQLATPDELRGRVTAVNFVFVNASNQLGAVESGIVAAATNAVFAVVSGGLACLSVVGFIAWKIPELRRYRAKAVNPAGTLWRCSRRTARCCRP